MGMDWGTRYEIAQAVPPAYSEYIARQTPPGRGHGMTCLDCGHPDFRHRLFRGVATCFGCGAPCDGVALTPREDAMRSLDFDPLVPEDDDPPESTQQALGRLPAPATPEEEGMPT